MKISIVGTGYVGLVTGVCLSDIGHDVTCIDIDKAKIEKMKAGISPIYEPGLDELMLKNINEGRLHFTSDLQEGYGHAEIVYIAVGTPENPDGTANLTYIENAAKDIAQHITQDVIVVTKSTVPVGTNEFVKKTVLANLAKDVNIEVASNPEFLREGSAIHDTYHGDRIVIGTESAKAADTLEEVNRPFNIPVFKTDIRSAEMIKYASNAFLATKISFINEISNICEKLGANIELVSKGMGFDNRIGKSFLNAGIGYGGSCFPKDTKALVQISGQVDHDFELLKSVIEVNGKQQTLLVEKAERRFGSLDGKNIALLGLAFKPNTDDMREAASISISKLLLSKGASVKGYDPIAKETARKVLPQEVNIVDSIEEALQSADMVFILTEWDEIKNIDFNLITTHVKEKIVFDGRNCFDLNEMAKTDIEYHSIGRPSVNVK